MEPLTVVLAVAAIVVGLGLVVWWGNSMVRHPGQESSAMGDGMGGLIEAFNPGHARARDELKRHEEQGPVTPSPDDDEDDRPVRITRNPDGTPRSVRVRRPR